jgi:exopolysaccharide production protein ExoQ
MLNSIPIRTQPYGAIVSPFADRLLPLFFVTGLLFTMGGFVLQLSLADLSVDPAAGAGSLLSQAVLGTIYLCGIIVLLRTELGVKILIGAWPILLLPALALISVTWSTWPSLTVRRACALLGTITFGLSLTAAFDTQTSVRLVIRALTIALVLSIVWVVVFPRYGIHQASDAIQAVHAGKWRGIFAHKNFLGGQVASLALALLVLYGRYAFENYLLRFGAIALSLICLVKADSSSGFAIAFVLAAVGFCLSFVSIQPMGMRLPSLILIFGTLLLTLIFADDIWTVALKALGKDQDLTGRTEYWDQILLFMDGHWTLGFGYYAGFVGVGGAISNVTHQENFGSTHNGYLDLLVSFGFVGLIVVLGYVAWLFVRSVGFLLLGRADLRALRTFPLCVVIYVLQHNVVESSILAANTIVPLMQAIAAGILVREGITQRTQTTPRLRSHRSAFQYVPHSD